MVFSFWTTSLLIQDQTEPGKNQEMTSSPSFPKRRLALPPGQSFYFPFLEGRINLKTGASQATMRGYLLWMNKTTISVW